MYKRQVQRISNLIKTWIAFEVSRQPFHVISLEKPFRLELAGIEFSLRADRIDKVGEDLILIDYKTGKVNLSQARSDNLKDPQLAAYALAISGLKGTFLLNLMKKSQNSLDFQPMTTWTLSLNPLLVLPSTTN